MGTLSNLNGMPNEVSLRVVHNAASSVYTISSDELAKLKQTLHFVYLRT